MLKKFLILGAILTCLPTSAFAQSDPLSQLASSIDNLINRGTTKIVADIEAADSIAGAVDPNSNVPAPNNVYDLYAHTCFQAIVPWLKTLPSPTNLPTPVGAAGLITKTEVARITLQQTQNFITKIELTGVPVNIHLACDSYVLSVSKTPLTLATNAQADILALLKIFTP